MISTILCMTAVLAAPQLEASADVPSVYVKGESFVVTVDYAAGEGGASLETWRLTPAAFDVNGKALGERGGDSIPLAPGTELSIKIDLKEALMVEGDFRIALVGDEVHDVSMFQPAPDGANFMEMPVEELDDYVVLLETNQGNMLVEFYPDIAPGHVRNFLDLASDGFYEGTLFHRVSPNFMVQGGCPNTKTENKRTWGTGRGPRMLDAEFNARKHVRGILSAARGPSPNSASCQFFIMTATYPSLDNKYSVFGKLVSGDDTLTKISTAQGRANADSTVRPNEPQRIERTRVFRRGA